MQNETEEWLGRERKTEEEMGEGREGKMVKLEEEHKTKDSK